MSSLVVAPVRAVRVPGKPDTVAEITPLGWFARRRREDIAVRLRGAALQNAVQGELSDEHRRECHGPRQLGQRQFAEPKLRLIDLPSPPGGPCSASQLQAYSTNHTLPAAGWRSAIVNLSTIGL